MATKVKLIERATETGAGKSYTPNYGLGVTYQAIGSVSEGTGAATVDVEVSNDESGPYLLLGTITLDLSLANATDGFASTAPWVFVRGNVRSISGASATVSLIMGV